MDSLKRVFSQIGSTAFLPYILLTIVVCVSYANSLENRFIWDDEFLIQKNSYLKSFEHLPKMLVSNSTAGFGGQDNFFRPTQNIMYLFIYQMFGMDETAFHVGNTLLHLINSFLLFIFAFQIIKSRKVALITSLLWAAHPTHVEAVTYISGTADPLSLMFCLACLTTFPFSKGGKLQYTLSLGFFALALMSKEAIIVTPALLTLIVLLKREGKIQIKDYTPTLPFWGMAFTYLLIRKFVLNFNETFNFYKTTNIYTENLIYRVYTYLATLPEYLIIIFRPTNLHMEREFPVHINFNNGPVLLGLATLILTLSLAMLFFIKKKNFKPLFCWLWFFAAFVPMMGILVPVNSFILEHWLYVPSIGFFLVLAMSINASERIHKLAPLALTVLSVAALSYYTRDRNEDWKTPISFYTNVLKYGKGSARIHNNLAMAYSEKENWDDAITHYKRAIATSDSYAQTHYNLARALIRQNKLNEALSHLDRSLEINPSFHYSVKLKSDVLNFLQEQSKNESRKELTK